MEAENYQVLDTVAVPADELFMRRALELAGNGRGSVSPNPLVGCVIVYDGKIIAEGWHKKYGQAHAEVNAINALTAKDLLKNATLYVNLEPCSHTGKTPPCADLIVRHQVKKVVIGNTDTNPLVAGGGIKKLRDAGIEVVVGVLNHEASELNKRFFTYIEKKRPYIILKWAETSDGFLARNNHNSRWISSEFSRQLVHKWRSEEDAVLVGSGTAWYDNPTLNVREWSGRNPVRVVIDRYLKLGHNQHLFDHSQKTICYNLIQDDVHKNLLLAKLPEENFFDSMIEHLYRQNIQSIVVEGGAHILNAFIENNLWDEARVFVSPQKFVSGIASPRLSALLKEEYNLQTDVFRTFVPAR
jgi:diaminohydroxyphosphoribosylaminopyrimidine deaminase/5-amino-6-(5-phosphoribosylamino)uracil reductase